jgi:hypothetical protein
MAPTAPAIPASPFGPGGPAGPGGPGGPTGPVSSPFDACANSRNGFVSIVGAAEPSTWAITLGAGCAIGQPSALIASIDTPASNTFVGNNDRLIESSHLRSQISLDRHLPNSAGLDRKTAWISHL